MNLLVAVAADLICIAILVFGVYYRRHFRRDLVLAYVSLNVGIMAVTALLLDSGAGIGLGMGLFGILSIIRLRSDAITQEEVAYYFVALAMGLVNGLHPGPMWLTPSISLVFVVVMYAADHPHFAPNTRRQSITLDRAYTHEPALKAALAGLLDADVLHVVVQELDTVRDITVVDVRFRRHASPAPLSRPGLQDMSGHRSRSVSR